MEHQKATRILGTFAVFFTAISGLVLLVQYIESRDLIKVQKEIADLELKKLKTEAANGST